MASDSRATGNGGVAGRPEGGIDRVKMGVATVGDGVAEATLGVTGAGSAFPFKGDGDNRVTCSGMSLRDWFAGQAMQGMASVISVGGKEPHYATLAMRAYSQADEMLAARNGEYRPGTITLLAQRDDLLAEAQVLRCLATSPRFQSMTVADALAELTNNGCGHDNGVAIAKAPADRSSPAGTRPAEHTPGTVGTEARRDGECDFCGGSGVIRIERDTDGSGGGCSPCSRCRPSMPRTSATPDALPSGAQSQRTLNATLDAMRRSPVPGVDVIA